jgi:pyruvate ferredoxin oxidoreductase gamma subunit
MRDVLEIRWHGRGGQGAVTAAKLVAEVALGEGLYFQAFPEYGPERSGAPIVAFTRISEEPIRIYCGVEHPGVVVVLDPTLLDLVDVARGAPDEALLLVNAELAPAELRVRRRIRGKRLATVPADRIAREAIGRPTPNTPLVGALTRLTGLFPLDHVAAFLREEFGRKFSPAVATRNVDALRRAYEEVRSE